MSAEGWHLATTVVCAVYGLATGALVPKLIAAIPEPADGEPPAAGEDGSAGKGRSTARGRGGGAAETTGGASGTGGGSRETGGAARETSGGAPERQDWTPEREDRTHEGEESAPESRPPEPEEPKERYADIAARRGVRAFSVVATAVVSALLGARLGWRPELGLWLYLAPVGIALAVIDWRTRLLPTRVIAPSYAVVVALAVAAAALSGDWSRLETAGWGWLLAGGTFFLLWLVYPRGMGYGDVRLSGVLGVALGYLGWGQLLTGVYAGFLLGGVGGLLLSALRLVDRKAYPFGPFMLAGALVGVLAGPGVAAWYA